MPALSPARSRDLVSLFGPRSHKEAALGTEKLMPSLGNLFTSPWKLCLVYVKGEKFKYERKV